MGQRPITPIYQGLEWPGLVVDGGESASEWDNRLVEGRQGSVSGLVGALGLLMGGTNPGDVRVREAAWIARCVGRGAAGAR